MRACPKWGKESNVFSSSWDDSSAVTEGAMYAAGEGC